MSWVTIVWSMAAAVCLTIAAVHLTVWIWQRSAWGHLLFAMCAVSVAGAAGFELGAMRARSPAQYGELLRWMHVPLWVLSLSLVWFMRTYFSAGRAWLAWTISVLRTVVLVLNFLGGGANFNFRAISEVELVSLPFGEMIAVPIGTANAWAPLGPVTLVLILVYFIDIAVVVWRRGDRERGIVVGGCAIFFISCAIAQSIAITWGIFPVPVFLSSSFLGVIVAMGYELSRDVHRAAALTNALKESERRIDYATAAAELGLWSWSIDSGSIWLTRQGRAQFGFNETEEITFDRVLSAIHRDDQSKLRGDIDRSLKGRTPFRSEYRIVTRNGHTRWIDARGDAEYDDSGRPILLRGITMDITARKVAEERFGRIVESAPNGIIMIDAQGKIVLANPETERIFGYAKDELIGQVVEMLVPEPLRAAHAELRHDFESTPSQHIMDAGRHLVGRRKDGTEIPIEIALKPVESADSQCVLASIVDITDRKRAELEYARQRGELMRLSRAATLGELSGSLAHELNQPLTAILSNAQAAQRFLARENADLEEVAEILADIVEDDKRAGKVISNVRLLLKNGEVRREPIDINEVIRDTLRLVQSDLIDSNVWTRVDLQPGLTLIHGDRVQIQQVLLNLIINACHAIASATDSSREIIIGTESNGSDIHVTVSDDGCGIPPQNLERIFEPLFTTRAEGMGLGLAVCRTIVNAHSGRLWATNNPGGGATFHLVLRTDGEDSA